MTRYRRKGRPKLNYSRYDKGTDALQQKRKALFKKGKLAEMFLTSSLLGLFYAHKIIHKAHLEVGWHFAELGYKHEACLGYSFRARKSGLLVERVKTCQCISEEKERKRIKAWRGALQALKNGGIRPYSMVMTTVFYENDLYTQGIPKELLKRGDDLCQGLSCLEKYFKR